MAKINEGNDPAALAAKREAEIEKQTAGLREAQGKLKAVDAEMKERYGKYFKDPSNWNAVDRGNRQIAIDVVGYHDRALSEARASSPADYRSDTSLDVNRHFDDLGLGAVHERQTDGWVDSSSSAPAMRLHGALASLGVPGTMPREDRVGPGMYSSNASEFEEGKVDSETKRYAKEMYLLSQAALEADGVKEVKLYRGVGGEALRDFDMMKHVEQKEATPVGVLARPASSWTDKGDVAWKFANNEQGVVVAATYPASAVYTNHRLFGNHHSENEYVVLGAETGKTAVLRSSGGSPAVLDLSGTKDEDWLRTYVKTIAPVTRAEFDESAHPRDPDGKFASGGGEPAPTSTGPGSFYHSWKQKQPPAPSLAEHYEHRQAHYDEAWKVIADAPRAVAVEGLKGVPRARQYVKTTLPDGMTRAFWLGGGGAPVLQPDVTGAVSPKAMGAWGEYLDGQARRAAFLAVESTRAPTSRTDILFKGASGEEALRIGQSAAAAARELRRAAGEAYERAGIASPTRPVQFGSMGGQVPLESGLAKAELKRLDAEFESRVKSAENAISVCRHMEKLELLPVHQQQSTDWVESSASTGAMMLHHLLKADGVAGSFAAGDPSASDARTHALGLSSAINYHNPSEADLSRYTKEIYSLNQAAMKAAGVSEVKLYRGVGLPGSVASTVKTGEVASMATRPASSWTKNQSTAEGFALEEGVAFRRAAVLEASFHANEVYASHHLFGNASGENEYVTLGAEAKMSKVVYLKDTIPDTDDPENA